MRAHLDTLKQLTEAERRDFSALTISGEPEQIADVVGSRAAPSMRGCGVHPTKQALASH